MRTLEEAINGRVAAARIGILQAVAEEEKREREANARQRIILNLFVNYIRKEYDLDPSTIQFSARNVADDNAFILYAALGDEGYIELQNFAILEAGPTIMLMNIPGHDKEWWKSIFGGGSVFYSNLIDAIIYAMTGSSAVGLANEELCKEGLL